MDEPSFELLERHRQGDEQAATEMFRRYVGRLTVLARARLAPKIARRIDPEDVVYSAYRSFFVRARNGQFALEQSGDLWRLLVGIVLNKLYHQVSRHTAEKRSVNREIRLGSGGDSAWNLLQLACVAPPAEQALELADLLEAFMQQIPPRSRRILELRLHGLRIEEIAGELQVHEKTIRRILADLENRLRNVLLENGEIRIGPIDASNADESPENAHRLRPKAQAPRAETEASVLNSPVAGPKPYDSELAVPVGTDLKLFSDQDFVIEFHLGRGGSGKVYRARRKTDHLAVAIKMLHKVNHNDPAVIARFFDEARMVAGLRHPGIVAVLGFGRTRGGSCFLVQQLVDGQSLSEIAADRPIGLTEALAWVATAAEALHHAHRQNVVHCDLKPANILVDVQGIARVTDFGLAQIIGARTGLRTAIAGTFGYISPEQIDSSWGPIGPTTDVFGLGAVLFALLAGRAPFAGNSLDELLQNLLASSPTARLLRERPELPGELGTLLAACLSPDPRDRPSSAAELAARLREFARR
ncbi:MAG: protein kinase [Planctomycetes bacterium]|nr:protein kinase [Planctomycetota bacterium]